MGDQCVDVGDANPDIAGIGILSSFGIQALLTIIISIFSFVFGRMKDRGSELKRNVQTWDQLEKITITLLETNSDVQNITAISLLISALVQIKTLTFYHMHLIYDTVSFVGVSTCAAVVFSLDQNTVLGISRIWLVVLWGVFFLIYTILFGKRLQSWDYNTPGHCYNARLLAGSTAQHPYADNFYIGITCFLLFGSVCGLGDHIMYGRASQRAEALQQRNKWIRNMQSKLSSFPFKFFVLYLAFFQFPLHAYSVIALRISNESLLTSGNVEQEWGFGQVSAMILLAPNLIGLIAGITGLKTLTNMAFKNISAINDARKKVKPRKGFSESGSGGRGGCEVFSGSLI